MFCWGCYGGGGRVKWTDSSFLDTLITIFLCALAMACVIAVMLTMFSPKGTDGASQLFGYELRIVESDSMEECDETNVSGYEIGSFQKNTMIALELVPDRQEEAYDWYSAIEEGDVLTIRYAYDRQVTITHRVISIEEKDDGSGFIIELEGDNKNSDATQLKQVIDTSETESHNYVIGKVVWKSYFMGVVVGGFQRVTKSFVGG